MSSNESRRKICWAYRVLVFAFLIGTFGAPQAHAKSCQFVVFREVCPERDSAELLKPYQGKNEFPEEADVPTLADCLKKAEVASKILRPGQFRSKKVIKIFFDQKAADSVFADSKECKGK